MKVLRMKVHKKYMITDNSEFRKVNMEAKAIMGRFNLQKTVPLDLEQHWFIRKYRKQNVLITQQYALSAFLVLSSVVSVKNILDKHVLILLEIKD